MKCVFRKGFLRDLKKIKDQKVLDRVSEVLDATEMAHSNQDIPALKKLSGEKDYFRIRVGEYRIGIRIQEEAVEFVRCLPRKDIYRYFPD